MGQLTLELESEALSEAGLLELTRTYQAMRMVATVAESEMMDRAETTGAEGDDLVIDETSTLESPVDGEAGVRRVTGKRSVTEKATGITTGDEEDCELPSHPEE